MGCLLVRSKYHKALIVSQRKFNAFCTIKISWGKVLSKLKKEYSGQLSVQNLALELGQKTLKWAEH